MISEIANAAKEVLKTPLEQAAKKFNPESVDNVENKPTKYNHDGLNVFQQVKEMRNTGFSKEVISKVGNLEELKIYVSAGLKEVITKNGIGLQSKLVEKYYDTPLPKCPYPESDRKRYWKEGTTNRERMEKGDSPVVYDKKNGTWGKMELHHTGQGSDGILSELTHSEHMENGNDNILHQKANTIESSVNRNEFNKVKAEYWKERSKELSDI